MSADMLGYGPMVTALDDRSVVGGGLLSDDRSDPTPLADALEQALHIGSDTALRQISDVLPYGRRDRIMALLHIYDLHTAPLPRLGDRARFQHHAVVATLKQRCERLWLTELEQVPLPAGVDPDDAVAALRTIAARTRLPAVYKWLAQVATWPQVVHFLTLEGGPDAGFDDLVASCQIGLFGAAKLELATNYWDEMGDGALENVHTHLHDRLVGALDIRRLDPHELPTSALARSAFCGLLATNRWLQPEMLGALGLIELQAGPRCRLVLQAFDRCAAPADAYPFYEVHADVDPRHGKDWLENAIAPTVGEQPDWAPRMVRGALWRDATTNTFLDDVRQLLCEPLPDTAA
ncbi:MAG: iron-containing redox enzyme family protein [Actinomycetes bacterium]